MERIVILGKPDEQLENCLAEIADFQFIVSDSPDVMPDTAGVLITQQYAARHAAAAVQVLQKRSIPFAAVTSDASEENQAFLLESGISRLLFLPMSGVLLQKHLTALIGTPAVSELEAGFQLFSQIAESNLQRGAYVVREAEFTNIYRFVLRLQERMEKQAQLVIFSFRSRLNQKPEPGTLEEGFQIVQKCLRRGDIVCIYGAKILAIMMAANSGGGQSAADRIINTYHAYYCDSVFELQYEMHGIVPTAPPLHA